MAKKALQIVNYAALGAGSIGAGVVERVIPVSNPLIKSGVVIAAGIFLSTMKQEPVKFAGYGMIARGASGLATSFGIGEEQLSDELAGSSDIEDELADELAEAMEDELAADSDGSF